MAPRVDALNRRLLVLAWFGWMLGGHPGYLLGRMGPSSDTFPHLTAGAFTLAYFAICACGVIVLWRMRFRSVLAAMGVGASFGLLFTAASMAASASFGSSPPGLYSTVMRSVQSLSRLLLDGTTLIGAAAGVLRWHALLAGERRDKSVNQFVVLSAAVWVFLFAITESLFTFFTPIRFSLNLFESGGLEMPGAAFFGLWEGMCGIVLVAVVIARANRQRAHRVAVAGAMLIMAYIWWGADRNSGYIQLLQFLAAGAAWGMVMARVRQGIDTLQEESHETATDPPGSKAVRLALLAASPVVLFRLPLSFVFVIVMLFVGGLPILASMAVTGTLAVVNSLRPGVPGLIKAQLWAIAIATILEAYKLSVLFSMV